MGAHIQGWEGPQLKTATDCFDFPSRFSLAAVNTRFGDGLYAVICRFTWKPHRGDTLLCPDSLSPARCLHGAHQSVSPDWMMLASLYSLSGATSVTSSGCVSNGVLLSVWHSLFILLLLPVVYLLNSLIRNQKYSYSRPLLGLDRRTEQSCDYPYSRLWASTIRLCVLENRSRPQHYHATFCSLPGLGHSLALGTNMSSWQDFLEPLRLT